MLKFKHLKIRNMHVALIQNFSANLVSKEPFDNMIRGLIRGLFIREVIYWIVILYVQGGLPDWMTESVILIIVRLLDTISRGLRNSVYTYRCYLFLSNFMNYFSLKLIGVFKNILFIRC